MLAGGIAAGDREQVRRTASALLGWTLLVLTPLAVADRAAGRADRPAAARRRRRRARSTLAARFLLVFAPQVVLYGIGIVLTGVLQAHRRFAGPALAPLLSSARRGRGLPGSSPASAAARDVDDLSTPGRAGARRGDDARRGGAEPEPAGAAARAAAGPAARRCASRSAPRPGCGGWPSPGCSPSPASSWWRRSRSGWPTTGPDGTQVVYFAGLTLFLRAVGGAGGAAGHLGLPGARRARRDRRRGRLPAGAGAGRRPGRRRRGGRGRRARRGVGPDGPGLPRAARPPPTRRRPARHDHRLRPRPGRATRWSPC